MKYTVVKTLKSVTLDSVSGDTYVTKCWDIVAVNFATPEAANKWAKSHIPKYEEYMIIADYKPTEKNKKQS
jgi:hypothetical protein